MLKFQATKEVGVGKQYSSTIVYKVAKCSRRLHKCNTIQIRQR